MAEEADHEGKEQVAGSTSHLRGGHYCTFSKLPRHFSLDCRTLHDDSSAFGVYFETNVGRLESTVL